MDKEKITKLAKELRVALTAAPETSDPTLVETVLKAVAKYATPEDVFPFVTLEDWAIANGFDDGDE